MGPTIIVKDAALLRAMNHAQLQRIVVPVVSGTSTHLRRTSSSELELGDDEMAAAADHHREGAFFRRWVSGMRQREKHAAILGEALRLTATAAADDLDETEPFDGGATTTSVVARRRGEDDGCASFFRSGREAAPPHDDADDAAVVVQRQRRKQHLADVLERVANEEKDYWSLVEGFIDDQQPRYEDEDLEPIVMAAARELPNYPLLLPPAAPHESPLRRRRQWRHAFGGGGGNACARCAED